MTVPLSYSIEIMLEGKHNKYFFKCQELNQKLIEDMRLKYMSYKETFKHVGFLVMHYFSLKLQVTSDSLGGFTIARRNVQGLE